jgi:hypothetical protein
VYWTPTHDIMTPFPWNSEPPTHGMLTLLSMVFRTPYPWYIEHTSHGVLTVFHGMSNPLPKVYRTPYPWDIKSPTHRISNPLPWYNEPLHMVYRTIYSWYVDPSIHRISNPLLMVCWPPDPWYIKPPLLVEMRGLNFPWGVSKYTDENCSGVLNTMWQRLIVAFVLWTPFFW